MIAKTIRMICFLIIVFSLTAFADPPMERIQVKFDQIDKSFFVDTVGSLRLCLYYGKNGKQIPTYFKDEGEFRKKEDIDTESDTVPLSRHYSLYRFPVVASEDSYVQIIYDVKQNLRTWVSTDELENLFSVEVTWFDNLQVCSFVDMKSLLGTSNGRKIYENPDINSNYKVTWDDPPVFISAVKGNFVQVSQISYDNPDYCNSDDNVLLGWVRIRDDEGKLRLWHKGVVID